MLKDYKITISKTRLMFEFWLSSKFDIVLGVDKI